MLVLKELIEAIETQGVGIGDNIIKVDSFLNHRMDTALYMKMAAVFAEMFEKEKPDVVLTVEASGIGIAMVTAIALGNIPCVFAKKSPTSNVTGEVYQSRVYSFTHQKENHIRIAKEYIPEGCRVLIVDDFLANGEAALGLCDIVKQAGATVVGIGICVEKNFQPGRAKLEAEGYRVESLARVSGIENGKIIIIKD